MKTRRIKPTRSTLSGPAHTHTPLYSTKPALYLICIMFTVFPYLGKSQNTQTQHPAPEVLYGLNPERGQIFEQAYGGNTSEEAIDIITTDFGVAMCGWQNDEVGNKMAALWLIDSIGELIEEITWAHNGGTDVLATAMASDGNDGFVVTGRISTTYTSIDEIDASDKCFVLHINNNWQPAGYKIYEYNGKAEVGMDLVPIGNHEFWMVSNTYLSSTTGQSLLRKIDTSGTASDSTLFGTSNGHIYSHKVIQNQAEDLIVLCNDLSGTPKPVLYEFDQSGVQQATHNYSQAVSSYGYGLSEKPNGGYLIAGATEEGGEKGGLVLEVNADFSSGFTFERNNSGNEYLRDIVANESGSIAVGSTNNMGEGGYDVFVIHIDSIGDSIMTETTGTYEDDFGNCATPNTIHAAKGINAGGVAFHNSSGNKNGYLTHFGESWQQPCPLQRILFVDEFVSRIVLSNPTRYTKNIDSTIGILGDTAKESALIQFTENNESKFLVLYGLNWIFETTNSNASRGGVHYKIILNKFLSKAKRKGIHCSLASDISNVVFEGSRLYNITDSMSGYNFDHAGKISYLLLEHEFWNAQNLRSFSGNTKSYNPDNNPVPVALMSDHFTNSFNDHNNFLDTINSQKFKDANFRATHDYLDKLFFNWHDSLPFNYYRDTNILARKDKAKTLEQKSNAIFLVNYQKYWNIHWGRSFLEATYPDTTHVTWRYERQSYFGKNNRFTYFFPLFSGEYYYSSSKSCGDNSDTDYLGQYFRDPLISNNNFWAIEDTFIYQFVNVAYDSIMTTSDSTILSGFGWFKYSCFDTLSFTKTDLHECVLIEAPSSIQSPEYKKELTENNNQESGMNTKVYPNPANGLVNIRSNSILLSIKVININGQILGKIIPTSKLTSVDLSDYPRGIYNVHLTSSVGIENIKLVLK
ncbi:MAG: T9SS type A sorting domain-containing protein [Flavobacteriales bacterium]|nr:T9SS type A sorting domain-containing protein [Flavobacteriales bacterium]